jgi:hypothetical protein
MNKMNYKPNNLPPIIKKIKNKDYVLHLKTVCKVNVALFGDIAA